MSRISNNSFAVNSSLEQIVEISGGTITPSGTQDVDVVGNTIGLATSANQTTANTSLSNIDTNTSSIDNKITQGSDDTLSVAQQVLSYGRKDSSPSGLRAIKTLDNGTTCVDIAVDSVGLATEATLSLQSSTISNIDSKITQGYDSQVASGGNGLNQVLCYGRDQAGNLDALKTTANGNLECEISGPLGSDVSANSVSVVIASDQSSIPVTTGTHSGSQANLFSASSVIAGDTSSVITTTSSSKINIFGNTTDTSNQIEVEMSADNSNWYPVGFGIFPDGSGNFAEFFDRPSNYWRIKVGGTATITATLLHA